MFLENLTLIFQVEFRLLQPHSIARERAVTKHATYLRLDMDDFVICSEGFEFCINYLFFLFVGFIHLSFPGVVNFLETIAFSKFFLQGEECDE